jgi:hypothetical protein
LKDLSDVLWHGLRATTANSNTVKIVGHKTNFVLLGDVPNSEITDASVILQKKHY